MFWIWNPSIYMPMWVAIQSNLYDTYLMWLLPLISLIFQNTDWTLYIHDHFDICLINIYFQIMQRQRPKALKVNKVSWSIIAAINKWTRVFANEKSLWPCFWRNCRRAPFLTYLLYHATLHKHDWSRPYSFKMIVRAPFMNLGRVGQSHCVFKWYAIAILHKISNFSEN